MEKRFAEGQIACMTRKEAEVVLEGTPVIVQAELEQGRDGMISGFGTWSVLTEKPRRGGNPKEGEVLTIGGRKVERL
jgi:nucleoid DNA-binding protein